MNNEKQMPLTLLDACTLLARETVSLLEGFDQIPDSAVSLRSALALVNSERDLGGGSLLAWVDAEMENTKHFAETGERTESLVKLKTPLKRKTSPGAAESIGQLQGKRCFFSFLERQGVRFQ